MLSNIEYIRFADVKFDTIAGSSSSTTWHIRDLTTVTYSSLTSDADIINNKILVLPRGLYSCKIVCPTYSTVKSQIALYNLTEGKVELYGQYERVIFTKPYRQFQIQLMGMIYCPVRTQFLICQYTDRAQASNGLGVPNAMHDTYDCVYTVAEFWKLYGY